MKVLVIGTGYVGLTTAVALAHLGHHVICHDKDSGLVEKLQAGAVPIYEPGLHVLLALTRGRIRFTTCLTADEADVDVAMMCVGTPSKANGDVELKYVAESVDAIGHALQEGAHLLVVNKSTVPVGTTQLVELTIGRALLARGITATVMVASNPEFLREGSALSDAFSPNRIVIGTEHGAAAERLRELYLPILEQTFVPVPGVIAPNAEKKPSLVVMKPTSSELAKYAANTFLAMKISFANEMSGIAELVGADINEVMHAVGLDARIGPKFLGAGVGWGGSCFGKDVRGLVTLGEQYACDMPLARATLQINERQRQNVVEKLLRALKVVRGTRVAIWGLTFKPNTDDLRDAPSLDIIRKLLNLGVNVTVFDPVGVPRAKELHPDLAILYAESPLDAVRDADALVMVTEWDIFMRVDWQDVHRVMRRHVVVDGRNVLDARRLQDIGFTYLGIGR